MDKSPAISLLALVHRKFSIMVTQQSSHPSDCYLFALNAWVMSLSDRSILQSSTITTKVHKTHNPPICMKRKSGFTIYSSTKCLQRPASQNAMLQFRAKSSSGRGSAAPPAIADSPVLLFHQQAAFEQCPRVPTNELEGVL